MPLENIPYIGREIYNLADKIFPICRSITGKGVRETLSILSEYIGQDGIEMNIQEVPSGTKVFDWTVPKEWVIRSAYIEDKKGKRLPKKKPVKSMKKNGIYRKHTKLTFIH